MNTKYTREQLLKFSNEELLEMTKGKAIDFHLYNGRRIQLCVNDFVGFDSKSSSFYTRTNIKIGLQDIDYLEIIEVPENS